MQSEAIKKAVHAFGAFLALASVAYIAYELWANAKDVPWEKLGSAGVAKSLVLSLLYSGLGVILALCWICLLGDAAEGRRRTLFVIYGITQIGRYLPGNIFHYAGRQALGFKAGIPHKKLVKAAFWELALIIGAGFCIVLPLLLTIWLDIDVDQQTAAISSCSVIVLAFYLIHRYLSSMHLSAFAAYFVFLVGSALVFYGVCVVLGQSELPLLITGGAFILAWLAGILTPGAPAGIGVREAILLLFLGPYIDYEMLLLAVLLARIVTTLGDVLLMGLSYLMNNKHIKATI